jgi:hypothetical protein
MLIFRIAKYCQYLFPLGANKNIQGKLTEEEGRLGTVDLLIKGSIGTIFQ